MSHRRALLFPLVFATLASLSSGCYCCHRPFLFRWRCCEPACAPACGPSCYPAFAPPPGAVAVGGSGCSSCAASPISVPPAGVPVAFAPTSFAPPSYPLGQPSVFTGPPTGIAPTPKDAPAPMPK